MRVCSQVALRGTELNEINEAFAEYDQAFIHFINPRLNCNSELFVTSSYENIEPAV